MQAARSMTALANSAWLEASYSMLCVDAMARIAATSNACQSTRPTLDAPAGVRGGASNKLDSQFPAEGLAHSATLTSLSMSICKGLDNFPAKFPSEYSFWIG